MKTPDPTPPVPPPGAEPLRRIQRSGSNRWIFGVAGGLAEYFGLHPAIYRVLFVALAFAGGTGILLYLALALVMPDEDAEEAVLTGMLRRHRNRPWLVIGLALLALVLLSSLGEGPGDQAGAFLLLLVAAVSVLAWTRASRRDERRAAARGRRSVAWRTTVVATGAVLLVAAVGGAIAAAGVKGGIGERVERPVSVADLEHEYRLGAGQLALDLTHLEPGPGETRIEARVGFGELEITLPPGVPADVTGDVEWGEIDVLGRGEDGRPPRVRVVDPGFDGAERRIVVDAHVRGGELRIDR